MPAICECHSPLANPTGWKQGGGGGGGDRWKGRYVADGQTTYLSILKDEETHVLPVVHLILTEDGRGKVLDPHASQLVSVDVVVLKTTLHGESEVRGQTGSATAKLMFIQTRLATANLHNDYNIITS